MATVKSYKLTTGYDSSENLKSSSKNDTYTAKVLGNSNTFQTGDEINGGAGTDTLNIVLGNESGFAISAETKNLEIVSVRSQSTNTDGNSGDNNVSNDNLSILKQNLVEAKEALDEATADADVATAKKAVAAAEKAVAIAISDGDAESDNVIDAQDMVGVKEFWNTDSRADLVIEDIRTNGIANPMKNGKAQILTENVTIGWKNTDPSSMEDKVDYEVYFSPESLRADVSSTLSIEWMDTRSAVDGGDKLGDLPYRGFSFTMSGKEYKVESDAIDAAKTYDQLLKAVTSAVADVKGLEDVVVSKGDKFTAIDTESGKSKQGDTISLTTSSGADMKPGSNITNGKTPADSGFHTNISVEETVGLITSKVILDNVGRESEAGDLVIGSMSTRSGVEKFKVDVLRSEATRNDKDDIHGNWVGSMSSTNEKLQEVVVTKNDGAYLYVGTGMNPEGNNLTTARAQPGYLNTDGLTDVRLFDASLMTGNVKVGANITATSVAKYQNLSDDGDVKDDVSKEDLPSFDDDVVFEYVTGSGSDTINLVIDSEVTASDSDMVTGRHDFSFNVEGNAGNDKIKVQINDATGGASQNWYNNQVINDNITVSGGAGNDIIETEGAGNMHINGNAGNDAIYADNSGDKLTKYVFNAQNADSKDLKSQAVASIEVDDLDVTVTFKGIASKIDIVDNSDDKIKVTDLMVNQAIKKAINKDFELSSLLTAKDGAGRTLLVDTKIDGTHDEADLTITFSSGDADFVKVNKVTDGYTSTKLATDESLKSSDSKTVSDNVISGGFDNDVIVLGTTAKATDSDTDTDKKDKKFDSSSNDTVVFSGSFGNDTIVNFVATGAGVDMLDFTAYGVSGENKDADGNKVFGTDKNGSIKVLETDLATIEKAYKGDAGKHVVIDMNAHNIANVYAVDTGVVTLVGSIDLADTAWSTLTDANFA